MTSVARIDAHMHVWDLAVRDQPWTAGDLAPLHRSFALADVADERERAGIEGVVLVQTLAVPEETPELLMLAGANTAVAGVVGWVDLTSADVSERLCRLQAEPFGDRLVGIRHLVQGEADPRWLCRPDVRRGLFAVADAGLAYDLLILPHQLGAAHETAAAIPELRFVVDHLAKPAIATGRIEPWATGLRALGSLPNVTCKLSGMVTEADWTSWTVAQLRPYAESVLDAFGADRVLFGSDWPVCTLAGSYDEVVRTAERLVEALDPAEREAVFGGAARAAYRLSPAARTSPGNAET
ncbi:MAG: Amidohydrolase family protein [Solirubrobacterales bacterium]|nr:Amidohydrolase family protein [Solirubrobacterales bacterium]